MYDQFCARLKLSHHRHSGKNLPSQHTSYGALIVLCVAAGAFFLYFSNAVQAGNDIALNGIMPGPPPSVAAVITNPVESASFSNQLIAVDGTCPDNVSVQIYKNNIFAGSAMCVGGGFGLSIDLLAGANQLIAKEVDNLNQFGPDSQPVNVIYNPPPPTVSPPPTASTPPVSSGASKPTPAVSPAASLPPQLLLTTDSFYKGAAVTGQANLKLIISGGTASYAASVDWGDKQHNIYAEPTAGEYNLTHSYSAGGIYKVQVELKDAAGQTAILRAVILVNAPASPKLITSTSRIIPPSNSLLFLLPYLLVLSFLLIFWVGERYEAYLIKRSGKLPV